MLLLGGVAVFCFAWVTGYITGYALAKADKGRPVRDQ
jgi:hypothetical protein